MPIFITSDGAQFECTFCGLASVGILYVDLLGLTLQSALTTFGDSGRTSTLTYKTLSGETVYKNFIVILGVEKVGNAIRISLRRPYEGEVI